MPTVWNHVSGIFDRISSLNKFSNIWLVLEAFPEGVSMHTLFLTVLSGYRFQLDNDSKRKGLPVSINVSSNASPVIGGLRKTPCQHFVSSPLSALHVESLFNCLLRKSYDFLYPKHIVLLWVALGIKLRSETILDRESRIRPLGQDDCIR